MANKLRGEVAVEIGEGKDRKAYVFRLGVNEMIEVQTALGIENDEKVFSVLGKLRNFKTVRTIVFHGLKGRTPDITEESAGEIITELGMSRTHDIILEALRWAMPEPEKTEGKANARSPGMSPS
jgi:hypothetical protein